MGERVALCKKMNLDKVVKNRVLEKFSYVLSISVLQKNFGKEYKTLTM